MRLLDKEKARRIEWEFPWSTGAPCPLVLSSGYKTFLTYFTQDGDNSSAYESIAIVEFRLCHSHRFGIVNDEAASGHPLYGKGLEVYGAHEIENSKWISELKDIHRVHPYYLEGRWDKRKHYLLFFHDEIFECVAEGYSIEKRTATLEEISIEITKKLIE